METVEVLGILGISLGVGLLVGLQRERMRSRIGGVRTFALLALLGTICALASDGPWIVGAGLIGVAALTIAANFLTLSSEGRRTGGLTTEVAALVVFALGAYAAVGEPAVVLALGVAVALLLHAKGRLHSLAAKVGDEDMRAILLFAAITFIVLPVLPNQRMGPFGVWNPREIWLIVVLVVGISLGGYIAFKVFGGRAGTALSGAIGGVISSTATTVSFARRGAATGAHASAAVAIIIAGTIVYARVLVLIGVAAPSFFPAAAPPIGVMLLLSLALGTGAWHAGRNDAGRLPEPENPTALRSALLFAVLYAAVLGAVAAGERYFGRGGVYIVAAISGLTDMNAITLSSAQLATDAPEAPLGADTARRAIILALVSNLVFRTGIVAALGGRRLLGRIAGLFGVQIIAGIAILLLWPRTWTL